MSGHTGTVGKLAGRPGPRQLGRTNMHPPGGGGGGGGRAQDKTHTDSTRKKQTSDVGGDAPTPQ
jgi:hypothetical protein